MKKILSRLLLSSTLIMASSSYVPTWGGALEDEEKAISIYQKTSLLKEEDPQYNAIVNQSLFGHQLDHPKVTSQFSHVIKMSEEGNIFDKALACRFFQNFLTSSLNNEEKFDSLFSAANALIKSPYYEHITKAVEAFKYLAVNFKNLQNSNEHMQYKHNQDEYEHIHFTLIEKISSYSIPEFKNTVLNVLQNQEKDSDFQQKVLNLYFENLGKQVTEELITSLLFKTVTPPTLNPISPLMKNLSYWVMIKSLYNYWNEEENLVQWATYIRDLH